MNILGSGGNKVMPVDIPQGMYDPFCYFFFFFFRTSLKDLASNLPSILKPFSRAEGGIAPRTLVL